MTPCIGDRAVFACTTWAKDGAVLALTIVTGAFAFAPCGVTGLAFAVAYAFAFALCGLAGLAFPVAFALAFALCGLTGLAFAFAVAFWRELPKGGEAAVPGERPEAFAWDIPPL